MVTGYGPSRVRRRMPRRFWTALSSSPSFFAAQMNAQMTSASVTTLTAATTIPRNVLTPAAYEPSEDSTLGWASVPE
jgi:hypothetical protein